MQLEENRAAELVAAQPDPDDPSLLAKASAGEPTPDLSLPLFEDTARLAELAAISPKAALLAIFGELEEQVRGPARDAGLLPEGHRPEPLGQVTSRLVHHNWLNGWHANVIRSLSNARNAAAHRPSDVPDLEVTALLDLAIEIAGDVKIRRRAALAGYEPDSDQTVR